MRRFLEQALQLLPERQRMARELYVRRKETMREINKKGLIVWKENGWADKGPLFLVRLECASSHFDIEQAIKDFNTAVAEEGRVREHSQKKAHDAGTSLYLTS